LFFFFSFSLLPLFAFDLWRIYFWCFFFFIFFFFFLLVCVFFFFWGLSYCLFPGVSESGLCVSLLFPLFPVGPFLCLGSRCGIGLLRGRMFLFFFTAFAEEYRVLEMSGHPGRSPALPFFLVTPLAVCVYSSCSVYFSLADPRFTGTPFFSPGQSRLRIPCFHSSFIERMPSSSVLPCSLP